jgi:nicotinate-nucleotide pyrophosphorylase (carboxylating)
LPGFDLDDFVTRTLAEDLGEGLPGGGHDVTSESVIPAGARFAGVMDSRDAVSVCGLPIAAAFFRALDPTVKVDLIVSEGDRVLPGTALMRIEGSARALLTAERSALNTVQHLTGIATLTRSYVDAMGDTRARLLDTRKTIPGLRVLEKYAVRTGGGHNHRMGLWDAAMIKDNHVAVAGGVAEAVRSALNTVQHLTGIATLTRAERGRARRDLRSRPDRPDRACAGRRRHASPARQHGAADAARSAGAGGGPCAVRSLGRGAA